MKLYRFPRSLWLGFCLLALGLAAGCGKGGGKSPQGKPGSGGGQAAGTILIGEYAPLSGGEAAYGQSMRNGIALAFSERNAAGGIRGRKLELKAYDTRGNSREAGAAVARLITEDKVVALLGELTSARAMAGGRVAQHYGVPMITPTATNPQVTEIGDMVFRVCFSDPYQGYASARFVRENLKLTKAAVLFDQAQPYGSGLKDYFIKAFRASGGIITSVQAYSTGDQAFTAQLTTIRDSHPDVVFIPGYCADVGPITIQARKLGLKMPLIGGDGWDSPKLVEIAGAAVEGCYYTSHCSPQDRRPEVQVFTQKFQKRYHVVPDAFAAMGYDAAGLLFDAIGRAPSLGGQDLARAIGQTRGYRGVTGLITLDERRNASKPAVVLQIKSGKPVYVATIAPR